jgi:type I restriction-modification system DNA methylase subunit
VTLYVMQDEEAVEVDIAKEYSELKALEAQKQEISKKLGEYISEITQALGGSK